MFKVPVGSPPVGQGHTENSGALNITKSSPVPSRQQLHQGETGFVVTESEKKILFFSREALSILSKGNEPIMGNHFFKTLSKAMHRVLELQPNGQPLTQNVTFKSGRRYYSVWNIPLFKHHGNGMYGVATAKRSLLVLERMPMEEPHLPLLNRTFGFTPRESSIIRLLFRGRSDKLIGQALGISTETVREHMRNIRAKLGAVSRLEVVSFLLEK